MENKVVILRGLPGAGKSTWVKNNHPDADVCSADFHYIGEDGDYKFDPSQIVEAHAKCRKDFRKYLYWKVGTIIVDNTNLQKWEFAYYVYTAEAEGYVVEAIRLEVSPETCQRNIHGVPLTTLERMANGFESSEPLCHETIVNND